MIHLFNSSRRRNYLCLLASLLFVIAPGEKAFSQTYLPRSYWTFDNPASALKDSMNLFNLDPNYYQSAYTINTNSAGQGVGKYMTLGTGSGYIKGGQLPTDSAFTIEFLFRPGYNFKETRFFSRIDGAFSASFNYPYITFYTFSLTAVGGIIEDDFKINLDGVGRKTYGYFIDGNWHHIVFKFNANSGIKEVWVDGQLPQGFSKTVTSGHINNTAAVNKDLMINTWVPYQVYYGDMDEIAIYSYGLPANMIYKHYLDFQNHGHYTFPNSTIPVPTPSPVTAGIDINEYPPGHPTVTVSALDQLKSFPSPRYKTGHTLIPNFSWIDPMYLSGRFQPGISDAQSVTNSVALQTEMAKNFNYMLSVGSAGGSWNDSWINLANQNPQWKLSLITFRDQIPGAAVWSQSLASSNYLQNSSGQFLDLNGNISANKTWRPTAPTSIYNSDGLAIRSMLNTQLVGKLTRPVDFVNENGEVFPLISNTALSLDPQVSSAKSSSGLDWETFLASKYKDHATLPYRDQFMNLPIFNANTKYSEYRIDGHRNWQFRYEQSRYINTPINGKYYSTTDFYVRYPHNWRYWTGPWHGWQWLVEARYYEMALGDSLFSPFVSPGWDANPENDVRPAQYLGLLKCVGMLGAEFYYPSYFNEAASYMPPNPPPHNPNGYVWHIAVPSYAQAISSRYEDFLKNGKILAGDVPFDPYNASFNAFNYWTGDPRKLAVVRKSRTQNKYVITGTIQPNSNMVGNAELESVATITLDGQSLKFKVRRQGSTYFYDNTNTSAPVFYQLDEWHENKHPYSWTKDVNLEAENFEVSNPNVVIKTVRPNVTNTGDFTQFTSFVSFTTVSDLTYNFQPRGTTTSNYYFWIRCRSKDGSSTGFNMTLDGLNQKTLECITDTNWTWYRIDRTNAIVIFSNPSLDNHILKITPANTKLEIDKISIINTSASVYGSAPNPCGNAATISASGPTTFCQGGNVTLTASSGTGFLWSTGATTQNIVVTTTGSYVVTVTSAAGSATSAPVSVTVNSLPTATISAGGATTFCQGGNVTLTSSAGTSYLWTPGNLTTQAISATSSGSYTVRVTGANGCSATSSATVVTVNALPTAAITAGGSTTICQGKSVSLTSSSGSSYLWIPGNQTTQSIIATAAGSYTVRVTGSNGCSATSSATVITVNPLPTASITPGGATTFCQGGNVTLTSSTGTSYLWTPGNQTTQAISATSSGSYTVRVTGSNGCSATSSVTAVTVNSLPTATISANGPLTFNLGGSVTLTSSTGTSYLWTPGNQTTQSKVVTTSGSYTVRVTNSNGCSATSSAIVVNVIGGSYSISTSGPTTFCQGGSVTLTSPSATTYLWSTGATTQSIVASSSGTYTVTAILGGNPLSITPITVTVNSLPTATITAGGATTFCQGGSVTLTSSSGSAYLWTPGNQTTQSISVTTSGNYIVRVTGSNGCSATSTVRTVTVNPSPTATISASGSTSICSGSSVTLTASSGSYYLWTPGGQTTSSISVSTAGSYAVRVTNSSGCSATSATTVVTVVTCGSCPIPTGLDEIGVAASYATLIWAPVSGVDSLQVKLIHVSSNYTYYTAYFSGTYTDLTVGAQPNSQYRWRIRSKCGSTVTAWSSIAYFTTLPIRMSSGNTNASTIELTRVIEPGEDENENATIAVFPNPAKDYFRCNFNAVQSGTAQLKLRDMTGKITYSTDIELQEGENSVPVETGKLAPGVYIVDIYDGNVTRFAKVVVH